MAAADESETQQGRPPRALIIESPTTSALVVGSLPLAERWQRSLAEHRVSEIRILPVDEVGEALRTAAEPVVLAWDGWVMEHLLYEPLIESAALGVDDDIMGLTMRGSSVAPVMVLSANAAQQVGRLPPETLNEGPDAIVAVLAPDDALSVDLRGISEGYWARVPDPAGAREATWQLLRRLQWRPGGVVAKWINRPISIRLSRYLVGSRITPNQTTMFAFAVGLLGIISIMRGGYWNAVLGTALLQVNSILDGIDGELARIRHQTSEFGAYLDSVCDEVLNAGLLVAVGWALTHFKHGGDPTYQWLGLFAGAAAFAHALVHWHCKWKHGLGFYWWFEAYKPRKAVQRSRSPFAYFKKLFWKESYLFLFMWAAVFDLMEVMMWISGVAAAAVYLLFFIHIPIKRARW